MRAFLLLFFFFSEIVLVLSILVRGKGRRGIKKEKGGRFFSEKEREGTRR